MNKQRVTVVGAGVAGCEASWQLANRGYAVTLIEMKPAKKTPAQQQDLFAELVCSNSLRADRIENAVGLLKQEMRILDSLIMQAADATRVPAGGALAVDRIGFSQYITDKIKTHPMIDVIEQEQLNIPDGPCIIATGPLTSDALAEAIQEKMGTSLYFFDAAAPIVSTESIDMTKAFRASRYGKGSGDEYINCPMNREQYFDFVNELVNAQTVELRDFENKRVFEGCMPVEVMASRGEMTLAFGPLKPVGLTNPYAPEEKSFAVVQLRQDNAEGTLFNMVGFQTHLKFGEQKRVFQKIPGLENAVFERYGVMHRNTFMNSPGKLNLNYQCIKNPDVFFAGQITGVEGYVESASSGLIAGISMACYLAEKEFPMFSTKTAHGALMNHVANYNGKNFQPMNVAFGLIDPLDVRIRDKQERYHALALRALEEVETVKASHQ